MKKAKAGFEILEDGTTIYVVIREDGYPARFAENKSGEVINPMKVSATDWLNLMFKVNAMEEPSS
jgi:hypothetical protein